LAESHKRSFRDAEIVGEQMARRLCHPVRERAFVVCAAVEHANDFTLGRTDVSYRVATTAGNVCTIAAGKLGNGHALVGCKQRNACLPLQDVMPFVGVRMPMRLMHRTGLE